MQKKSIVYVNFSPYDNAGKILDYLISNFVLVIHLSYDHLRLKNGRKSNILTVYENGLVVQRKLLIPLRTPEFFRFPSLPGVALLILTQTLWYSWHYSRRRGKIDYFLSVNAFTAWVGNLLRKTNLVDKTIFWVWDYYPPTYPDWRIRLLRFVYWKFDKPAVRFSDRLAFISHKLISLRKQLGVLGKQNRYPVIPIGTDPIKSPSVKRGKIIGFLGMLKTSGGLDLLFDNLPTLSRIFPDLKIEIIGSGPEETHFRARARKWNNIVKFWGFIEKSDEVDKIMRRWSVGLATYLPVSYNESYWTDPSKIKAYVSQSVPVVTTDVPYLAREIQKFKAGIVIEYNNSQQFIKAIDTLLRQKIRYSEQALRLAKQYEYRKIYKKFFAG